MRNSKDIRFIKIPLLSIGAGKFRTGTSFHQQDFKTEGTPLIKIGNMKEQLIDFSRVDYVFCKKNNLTEKNDLLIAMRGGTTGKLALVDEKSENCHFVGSIGNFGKLREDIVWIPYLKYIQEYLYEHFIEGTKGTATPMVSIEMLKQIYINIPDSIEAQKDLFQSLEVKRKNITNIINQISLQDSYLSRLRKSVLQDAIEGKLTAQWRKEHPELISGENHASKLLEKIKSEKERLIKEGKIKKEKPLPLIIDADKPFDLPEGWAWCRLGDWGLTQTGTTPSTFETSNFGKFIPFIKPGDISLKGIDYTNEGLSEKGLAEGRRVFKNSVLMVCIGGSIGKSYFIEMDVSCNQQINCITPLARINSELLQQFLQSKYFQFEVWDKAMKSSTPIINKGRWEEIPMPLPPYLEQQIILVRLDEIMGMINQLENQMSERKDQSEMLMRAVLREAFELKHE